MNAKQVKKIRAEINAAHARGDMVTADRLQSQLHDFAVAEAEAFGKSAEGQRWMTRLMDRP